MGDVGAWRDMGGLSSYDVLHDCLLGLKLRLGRKVKVEGKYGDKGWNRLCFFFFFFNSLGMVDFKLELMNPKSLKCCQRNSFFKLKKKSKRDS